jgi:hypothetical protein
MHSTGYWEPWTVSASWSPDEIFQSVVSLRTPAQCAFPVFRTQ